MVRWTGYVAAVGGALALISQYVESLKPWGVPFGAAVAIIFGIWAAYQ